MSRRGTEYGSVIYERSEWGARPPRSTTGIPAVEMVTVHYAGPSDWGSANRSSAAAFRDSTPHSRCDDIMRSHQNFHMDSRGWSDYAYNGAACPHGYGFIGRGRGVRSAAQGTTDGNNRSYAIQYLGAGVHGGVEDPITEEAKRAFYDMAAYLGMPLRRGHRDWKSTSCPGEPTYAWRAAGFPRPLGNGDEEVTPEQIDQVLDGVDELLLKHATVRYDEGAYVVREALGRNGAGLRLIERQLASLNAAVAQLDVNVEVDEQAIAQAIIGSLNPAAIASAVVAAVGPEIASDVVEALAAELAD